VLISEGHRCPPRYELRVEFPRVGIMGEHQARGALGRRSWLEYDFARPSSLICSSSHLVLYLSLWRDSSQSTCGLGGDKLRMADGRSSEGAGGGDGQGLSWMRSWNRAKEQKSGRTHGHGW
jgi:hypothetical protein